MSKLILLFISLLFIACSTSSIDLQKDGSLSLKYDKNIYPIGSKTYDEKFLNFKDLFIRQYKTIDDKQRVLHYDRAYTSMEFEFNFNDLYTILYIFDDAKSYEMVYKRNNLTFYQIKLKNETYVNVMLQYSDEQALSYVYGFSNDEFLDIALHLGKDATSLSGSISPEMESTATLKYNGVTLTKDSPRLTNYNDKMVFFAPLITPFRGLGRR